jgi:hypothetical protein
MNRQARCSLAARPVAPICHTAASKSLAKARETLASLEYSGGSLELRKAARRDGGVVVLKRKGRHVYAFGQLPG